MKSRIKFQISNSVSDYRILKDNLAFRFFIANIEFIHNYLLLHNLRVNLFLWHITCNFFYGEMWVNCVYSQANILI